MRVPVRSMAASRSSTSSLSCEAIPSTVSRGRLGRGSRLEVFQVRPHLIERLVDRCHPVGGGFEVARQIGEPVVEIGPFVCSGRRDVRERIVGVVDVVLDRCERVRERLEFVVKAIDFGVETGDGRVARVGLALGREVAQIVGERLEALVEFVHFVGGDRPFLDGLEVLGQRLETLADGPDLVVAVCEPVEQLVDSIVPRDRRPRRRLRPRRT